jgi:hypothetical protein
MPNDPYAPPPRHRDRSGALVRFVLIAAMLGVAVWGYTEFQNDSGPSLIAEEQQQTIADASNTNGYEVTQPAAPEAVAPAPAEPAARAQSSAPAPQSAPVPAPSTTIGPEDLTTPPA